MIPILILSVAFLAVRFWIAGNLEPMPLSVIGSFKAFAHLYVGALIGAAICGHTWLWWVVGVMSVLEVVFAVWSRKR